MNLLLIIRILFTIEIFASSAVGWTVKVLVSGSKENAFTSQRRDPSELLHMLFLPIFTPKNSQFLKPQNLLLIRDKSNNITTKLYDKCDAFGFHIVNFPFMSSNIPSAPAFGVYASQLIRYARCCSNYSGFLLRHSALVTRLLSQGYKVNRLSNTFKKFYGRHTDLVGQYKKNVCQMFADSIS